MSIKGFSVGGNVERYDYNSLDNLPSEITIDTALSDSSTNPVQNRVVTSAINSANGSISSISGEVDDLKSAIIRYPKIWNAVADGGCDNTNTNNCATIFQNAINNAEDGTIFYFPAGRYKFTSAISLAAKKDIRICGDGASWDFGTRFYFNVGYGNITFYGGSNIEIDNILFYNNGSSTASCITFADNTPTTMDCRVDGVNVHDIKIQGFLSGIRVSCPTGYMYFTHVAINHLLANGKGIAIGVNYANTAVTEDGHQIIPNNIFVEKCTIDDYSDGTASSAIEITLGQYIFLRDNDLCNFVSSTGYAITLTNNNSTSKKLETISIIGNSLYNNRVGVFVQNRATDEAIRCVDISHNIVVGRINAGSGPEFGIVSSVSSGAKKAESFNIIGNTFKHSNNGYVNFQNNSGIDEISLFAAGVGI